MDDTGIMLLFAAGSRDFPIPSRRPEKLLTPGVHYGVKAAGA